MTNLKEINFGLNQYCGPAMLSALTGRSTDDTAAVLMQVSGKQVIKAIEVSYIIKALQKLRFVVEKQKLFHRSLYGVLTHLAVSKNNGMFFVLVPHHVVAVEVTDDKVYLVDNASKAPIDASASARLSQAVEACYKVTPKGAPKFIRTDYNVEVINKTITVKAVNWYEDSTDNTTITLGNLRLDGVKESSDLTEKLVKAIINVMNARC